MFRAYLEARGRRGPGLRSRLRARGLTSISIVTSVVLVVVAVWAGVAMGAAGDVSPRPNV